jgi:hypothetical protein
MQQCDAAVVRSKSVRRTAAAIDSMKMKCLSPVVIDKEQCSAVTGPGEGLHRTGESGERLVRAADSSGPQVQDAVISRGEECEAARIWGDAWIEVRRRPKEDLERDELVRHDCQTKAAACSS